MKLRGLKRCFLLNELRSFLGHQQGDRRYVCIFRFSRCDGFAPRTKLGAAYVPARTTRTAKSAFGQRLGGRGSAAGGSLRRQSGRARRLLAGSDSPCVWVRCAAGNGAGQTIAIVDAYDDPNVASDLHKFDVQFGLSDPRFTKVSQTGSAAYPSANQGWASEIALDVEWAHAIAPGANILLVEARSASMGDLLTAVNYARNYAGASVVSMSWGGGESRSETSYDSYFTTPAGHAGVTFVASSGDDGAGVSYPAISPNVLSVGGTLLTLKSGNYSSETAWSGSGGGVSRYETEPSWQRGVQSYGTRTNPDVAFDANPSTGVAVYDSYGSGGWAVYGGTSIGAPQWAGLIAIVDQGRSTPLRNATSDIYSIAKASPGDFHDVTSGSNGYRATAGYDLVTGLGSPVANKLVADLIKSADAAPAASSSGTGSLSSGLASWGRWSVPLLPPGGFGPQLAFASSSAWQTAPPDVAAGGAAAGSYLSTPLWIGFRSSWHDADAADPTSPVLLATIVQAGDFGEGSSGSAAALLEHPLGCDASDATRMPSLAYSTAAAGLPAPGTSTEVSVPASAARDRLPAIPAPDLPAAAVDCCFDGDSFGEQRADANTRVDAVETTTVERATALAVIPLIFSHFEEEPAIGRADSHRRRHLAARECRRPA